MWDRECTSDSDSSSEGSNGSEYADDASADDTRSSSSGYDSDISDRSFGVYEVRYASRHDCRCASCRHEADQDVSWESHYA